MQATPEATNRANELRTLYSILDYAKSGADRIGSEKLSRAIEGAMLIAAKDLTTVTGGSYPPLN